jgi:LmbE family N-acetylglucosaminyl deacetylase
VLAAEQENATVQAPLSMRNVYLSPHFDDVAFSLGAWVAKNPGGTLVDIFTRSTYLAVTPLDEALRSVERVSARRDAEDEEFAARWGLERLLLGAEEPSLRGRKSRDPEGLEDDIAQIRAKLVDALATSTAGGCTIFCPSGIGRHVNHLATRSVVLDWFGNGRSGVILCFYEDLPYAARWSDRRRGIKDLRAAAAHRPLRRKWWEATTTKVEQLRLYPSQHGRLPDDLRRFSPAAVWPIKAHEAVWELGG